MIALMILISATAPATEGEMEGFWHSIDCIPAGLGESLFLFPGGGYFYLSPLEFSSLAGTGGSWSLEEEGGNLALREEWMVFSRWSHGTMEYTVTPFPEPATHIFYFNGEIVLEDRDRPMITDQVRNSFWKLMGDPALALELYVSPGLLRSLPLNRGRG